MSRFLSPQEAEGLRLHNDIRAVKKVQALSWDPTLAKHAQAWAANLAQRSVMEHSGVEDEGENLYVSSGDAIMPDAVRAWLGEERDYHGEKIGRGNLQDWGHFTQCVWHDTTRIGIGMAQAPDGSTYIVARYTPPGNMWGTRPY